MIYITDKDVHLFHCHHEHWKLRCIIVYSGERLKQFLKYSDN